MHVPTNCPQNQHFLSNMTPNQHRVGGKVQSSAYYMRTICRIGSHIERKQDTISNDWVPRPSGSGFHGIPANPQSAYCSIACTGLLLPPPSGRGAGGEGLPARTTLRVAPSSFGLRVDWPPALPFRAGESGPHQKITNRTHFSKTASQPCDYDEKQFWG